MKFITRRSSHSKPSKPSKKTNDSLEWAEFALRRKITLSLLALLWLCTIYALVVFGLILAGKVDASPVVVSSLFAPAIGVFVKLLNDAFKLSKTKE